MHVLTDDTIRQLHEGLASITSLAGERHDGLTSVSDITGALQQLLPDFEKGLQSVHGDEGNQALYRHVAEGITEVLPFKAGLIDAVAAAISVGAKLGRGEHKVPRLRASGMDLSPCRDTMTIDGELCEVLDPAQVLGNLDYLDLDESTHFVVSRDGKKHPATAIGLHTDNGPGRLCYRVNTHGHMAYQILDGSTLLCRRIHKAPACDHPAPRYIEHRKTPKGSDSFNGYRWADPSEPLRPGETVDRVVLLDDGVPSKTTATVIGRNTYEEIDPVAYLGDGRSVIALNSDKFFVRRADDEAARNPVPVSKLTSIEGRLEVFNELARAWYAVTKGPHDAESPRWVLCKRKPTVSERTTYAEIDAAALLGTDTGKSLNPALYFLVPTGRKDLTGTEITVSEMRRELGGKIYVRASAKPTDWYELTGCSPWVLCKRVT